MSCVATAVMNGIARICTTHKKSQDCAFWAPPHSERHFEACNTTSYIPGARRQIVSLPTGHAGSALSTFSVVFTVANRSPAVAHTRSSSRACGVSGSTLSDFCSPLTTAVMAATLTSSEATSSQCCVGFAIASKCRLLPLQSPRSAERLSRGGPSYAVATIAARAEQALDASTAPTRQA